METREQPRSDPLRAARGRRRLDRALGITLGVILGLGVLIVFIFLGSEGTIDAPRISGVNTGKPEQHSKPSSPAPAANAKDRTGPQNQ
jgi:hypothetical protein